MEASDDLVMMFSTARRQEYCYAGPDALMMTRGRLDPKEENALRAKVRLCKALPMGTHIRFSVSLTPGAFFMLLCSSMFMLAFPVVCIKGGLANWHRYDSADKLSFAPLVVLVYVCLAWIWGGVLGQRAVKEFRALRRVRDQLASECLLAAKR
jgi:hypothetical protein